MADVFRVIAAEEECEETVRFFTTVANSELSAGLERIYLHRLEVQSQNNNC